MHTRPHPRLLDLVRQAGESTGVRWALLALALLLSGCADSTGPDPVDRVELPRALSVAEQEVVAANQGFALNFLETAVAQDDGQGNLFLSPLSVSMALGMTANGAAGETLDSIQAVLGLAHLTRDEMNEAYHDLLDLIAGLDPTVETSVANSAWSRKGVPFVPAFAERVETWFDAEVQELDFAGDPDGSRETMNGWVSDRTGGRIDEIVAQVKPNDILFLLNAVYFKGAWTTQFDRDETGPATFYLAEEETAQVPMMREEEMPGRFLVEPGLVVGELPYGGDAFALVVAVPQDGDADALARDLTPGVWDDWMARLEADTLEVALPRFETETDLELEPVLRAMGMGIAFDDHRADFTDLTPIPSTRIDRVKHKTFLAVDEVGTEAAGATSVTIGPTSAPPSLRADRPFLLAIRERLTGSLLFVGIIRDPR